MAQSRAGRGLPPPEALAERPRQIADLIPITSCWWTLHAMRGVSVGFGGGVSSFPLTLGEYFDAHCVPAEARPRWIRLLAAMEATYKEVVCSSIEKPKRGKKGEADDA